MITKQATLLLALALVGAYVNQLSVSIEAQGVTDCRVPGAVADDGIDDRAAIQGAINARGCADLGPGVYDVATPVPPDAAQPRDMIALQAGSTLRGAGPATRLRFSGDARHAEWHGMALVGDAASLSDLTLDTAALTNTAERTHAVYVTGPALQATIREVWFQHPPRGGGDCIQVVSDGTRRSSAMIMQNHFGLCAHAGVSFVGEGGGMTITGNVFDDTGTQDIDIRARNAGHALVMADNVFRLGPRSQGPFAVSLESPRFDRVTFTGNTLHGRGVSLNSTRSGTIAGNTIRSTRGLKSGVLQLLANDDLKIANNVIVRSSTAPAGGVISITPNNSGRNPGTLTLTGNLLRNETAFGTVVNTLSVRRIVLTGNTLEWAPLPEAVVPRVTTLFATQGIAQKVESVSIRDNIFKGPATHAVQITGDRLGVGAVTLLSNTALGPRAGFRCASVATNPVGPMASAGNNWEPSINNSCAVTGGDTSGAGGPPQVTEMRQRSVTDDPAVMGDFPQNWLMPDGGAGLPRPPDHDEIFEFLETFKRSRAPRIVQEDLAPGATRTVELDLTGPSGLGGVAQWIGTVAPLPVTIALDGSPLVVTGTTYRMGRERGGSHLKTQTTTGGRAAMSVRNTSDVTLKVRIVFVATAL
jgi:hypothetical protein